MIVINPGTEPNDEATLDNAYVIASRIKRDLAPLAQVSYCRGLPSEDRNGWFSFVFSSGVRNVCVDIPGDDPEQTCEGRPWSARRLYVAGSSWLYPHALAAIAAELPQPQPPHSERDALYGHVCGLLGLLQLISGRDDMPREIIDVLETNHRVVDAKAFLTTITPPAEDNQ